jgi:hypothetical protein
VGLSSTGILPVGLSGTGILPVGLSGTSILPVIIFSVQEDALSGFEIRAPKPR